MKKRIAALGGAGFIGHHLTKRLKQDGHHVTVIDRKAAPEFEKSPADDYICFDLRRPDNFDHFNHGYDEVYQLAADMGGAGYLFTGENDAQVLNNSARINLNVLDTCRRLQPMPKIFFSSSACVYQSLRTQPYNDCQNEFVVANQACRESDAYPANPDSDYGWEKLFSERLYDAFARNYGMDIRIARYHNVFGPLGTYQGGREKFPAAVCRKVAEAAHGSSIELWGTGQQTRSFTYVDDAVEGAIRLMASDFRGPVNIGSARMVTIEDVARQVIAMSGKWLDIEYVDGPVGVLGRNSDNRLIKEKLGWEPMYSLEAGLLATYQWINQRVKKERQVAEVVG